MHNPIGVTMVIGDTDILRLDEPEITTTKSSSSDSSVSSGHLKNYSVQPPANIVQLYVLRKLPLDYIKVSIKF